MPTILAVLLGLAGFEAYRQYWSPEARGRNVNRAAWEASYCERGQAVPPTGPREGYWGSRLNPKTRDPELGWREAAALHPGLVEIDRHGHQSFRPSQTPRRRVIVLGGSVAFGAYASSIENTYFHILGRSLEKKSLPTEITVVAAGAWKSQQDVAALEIDGPALRPDLVVFLNGLNDLTNGANAGALFGQRVPTTDGSAWNELYHAHDYVQRVGAYLDNMHRAAQWCQMNGCQMLVVLQPSLFERARPTDVEKTLLENSLAPHDSRDSLIASYQQLRVGLRDLAMQPHVSFVDGSRVFETETATMFADCWHFADAGHAIVADEIARDVYRILTFGE